MPVREDLLEDLSGDGHPVEGEVSGQDRVDKRDPPSLVKLGKGVFNEALWLVYLLNFACLLCVEVRGQFLGSNFLLPPWRPQSSLRHKAWLQAPLPAEPASQRQGLMDPKLLLSLLPRQGCP